MNPNINPGIDVDKLNVLVVDDVPLNVLLIKKMLSQYTFQLDTANSGQAALDIIAKDKPDRKTFSVKTASRPKLAFCIGFV